MARKFAPSTQYLINNNPVLTGTPLTLAAWARVTDTSNNRGILCLGDNAANNQFLIRFNTPTPTVRAGVIQAGTAAQATSSASAVMGQWHHVCGVFASSTSRAAYLDGGGKGTNSTNNTPAGLDVTTIGALWATGAQTAVFEGDIAEAAIWSVALTDADVAVLARGISPLLVRPEGLLAYWPLIGRFDPEIDIVGGFAMTLASAPPTAAHPRILMPRPMTLPKIVAPVSNPNIRRVMHHYNMLSAA